MSNRTFSLRYNKSYFNVIALFVAKVCGNNIIKNNVNKICNGAD